MKLPKLESVLSWVLAIFLVGFAVAVVFGVLRHNKAASECEAAGWTYVRNHCLMVKEYKP